MPRLATVVADGLGHGEDVGLRERAEQRRAAVPAGAEADALCRIVEVRLAGEVLALEPGQVDQDLLRGGFAR